MSKKILAGADSFKEIREEHSLYVDKSEFISELLEFGGKVVAIARPRRFGKSLNMSMLSYFFDIRNGKENRELFKGLNIEKSTYFSQQGQYPVINITFKSVKERNWDECVEKIKSLVADEYSKHKYLLRCKDEAKGLDKREEEYFANILNEKNGEVKLKESLKRLSHFLYRYHSKEVVILIDEYDTPIVEGELKGYFENASSFMQSFLGDALKGNESIFKGVVTGITRMQGAGIFSGFNNADICTIFDKEYNDRFGFTEKEVKELLKEYGMPDKEEGVKEYYNGYNFHGKVMYNPFSVVKYIKKGKFDNYWLGSSRNDLARKKVNRLLEIKGDEVVRKDVENLLQRKKVRIKLKDSLEISEDMKPRDILHLMLHSGYLKYENYFKNDENVVYVDVSIPNLEIKAIYNQSIEEWVEKEYTMEEVKDLKEFLKSVCEGSEGEIKERLENYLNRRSVMDGERVLEMSYHNFLLGLLQGLEGRYLLDSNKESGSGRYDIMLTPIKGRKDSEGRSGVVIELKVGDKDKLKEISKGAIKQIEDKKYYKALESQGIKKVRLIGIAFHGKEAEVKLKEETLAKK